MVTSNLRDMLETQEGLLMGSTETPSPGRALEKETEKKGEKIQEEWQLYLL